MICLCCRQPSSGKREDCLSWEDYFMSIAVLSAKRSKDPNTQVKNVYHFVRSKEYG